MRKSPNIVDLESEEYFSIWNLGHPNYLPPLFSSTACQGGVFIENMFSKMLILSWPLFIISCGGSSVSVLVID